MEKELNKKLIFIGGIVIFLLLCVVAYFKISYSNMVNEYEMKIERLTAENLELSEDNKELSDEIKNLHKNIYNLFEKQPYELCIDHDDKIIIYSQDKFGLFDSYFKSIIY